jgi:succinate dehydrogenase / fumarate reductase iron-sulfur subunit
MLIRSSDQLPRVTALKRFPVPRNFKVSAESRIERGRTWPAPTNATRVKNFEIYRYNPDSSGNPRIHSSHSHLWCVFLSMHFSPRSL